MNKPLLSGGIYYTPASWTGTRVIIEEVLKVSFVTSINLIEPTKWFQLEYLSKEALIDPVTEQPPFKYPVFYRQSARRAVLVSLKRSIVEKLLASLAAVHKMRAPESVYVNVQGLVSLICDKPSSYAATYVHARTSGLGSALRSLSFYGDDVTGSSLYRGYSSALLPHTCGLRDVYANRSMTSEALRVSTEGRVSFYGHGAADLFAAEKALGYVNKLGFLLEPRGFGPRQPSGEDMLVDEIDS